MSSKRRKPYPFHEFEPKWQRIWQERQIFHVPNPGEKNFDPTKSKFYVLDMFPYPSGAGLHVGHPEGYTATDIVARYKRMRGFNVLHPMGWDAFGLPAEQYAIKTRQHPAITTRENVAKFKSQLQRIGFSYDWQREINTTDPDYYKWTQWIFLQIYNAWFNPATQRAEPISTYNGEDPDRVRLAYVADVPVNWCAELGTVLANEEVVDGRSEIGGFAVVRRPMRQWMLRITAYAERLIDELDSLDWPKGIKLLQRNWIGKSEGAEIDFTVAAVCDHRRTHSESNAWAVTDRRYSIRVFTTRPDTLYGATYMVLAPEHSLVDLIVTEEQWPAVRDYRERAARKSDLERTELAKEKTGVFTGAFALNPASEEKVPIWIADYVLLGYGTGAIMGVPAHDERDLEFARKFGLKIIDVVQPPDDHSPTGFTGEGRAINSPIIDGLATAEAKNRITAWLEERGHGKRAINYKLRDWLFSRQRYWGEPFPILWKNGKHFAVEEHELPVVPPELNDFKPTGTGEPPLAKAREWIRYSDKATRETNTMPQWAGSCWYYLRFCDPRNNRRFVGREAERYWMSSRASYQCLFPTDEWSRRIHDLLERAIVERGERPPFILEFASVSDALAARIEAAAHVDVRGFVHTLDVYGVRHVINHHGTPAFEEARGLAAVDERDFIRLPEVVAEPDTVEFGAKHPGGFRRIVLTKQVDGFIYVVEEVRTRKRQLLVITMWKKRATARDVTPKAPPSVTSETFRRTGVNVAEKGHGSKSGGVDLYVGGTEHAVLHLLYARFWHKVLFDLAYLSTPEPFQRLVNQGIILGEDGQKMSKSRGNVVNPDDVIDAYGADAFRCYEMFMGPLEQMKPWSMRGVEGVSRFLARVWRLLMDENQAGEWELSPRIEATPADKAQLKIVHASIKKVTEDIESLSFNTAISQMMVFVNAFTDSESIPVSAMRTLLVLLNPFAPHISSELWEKLNTKFPITPPEITDQPWPQYDEALLVEDEVEIIVQINGKLRDKFSASLEASDDELKTAALALPKIQELTSGKEVRKIILVRNKLVNIVIAS
jgi:leucyl-tRNA synthetase